MTQFRFLDSRLSTFYKKVLGSFIELCQEFWCYFVVVSRLDAIHKKYKIYVLKRKKQINVVFVVSFLSQWKYQPLYELIKKNPLFNATILVAPMRHHEQSPDFLGLKKKFDAERVEYLDFELLPESKKNIRKSLKPDLLFYIQPYYHIYDKRVDSHSFKDKLICYTVYGFQLYNLDWSYNLEFLLRAWKLFYISDSHRQYAVKYSINKGRNIEVVGYLNADLFREVKQRLDTREFISVWKKQTKPKKKVIWTPHFSIDEDSALHQGNFLNMADSMLFLANKYADVIQFSFKPHPSLYSILRRHLDWGKEKTDEYYSTWKNGNNTQLDEGEFVQLFLESDAMINDSGSFTVEYIYTLKPAINCFRNYEETKSSMMDVGKNALECQYRGSTMKELESFLEQVVLGDNDPLLEVRNDFYNLFLLPPNNQTVTSNIYNSVMKDLQ